MHCTTNYSKASVPALYVGANYRIAGMFGSGKVWQNWQAAHDLPNFKQPNFSL